MYIACSSLCFGKYPLDRALRTMHELQFQKVDLALHEHGPHLRPSEIALDVNRFVQKLRITGLSFAAFHVEIDEADGEIYRERLRAICRLARVLAVPVVNVPAAPIGSDIDLEMKRLSSLTKLATAEGIVLTVETHRDQVTADPIGAAELCKRVHGLGLTLDPSHYLFGPHPHPDYEVVLPFVEHVRLRDSGPNHPQLKVGQGQVEYGKIINQLERESYDRALTVDIRDIPETGYPLEPEVRKLKYLLESMV